VVGEQEGLLPAAGADDDLPRTNLQEAVPPDGAKQVALVEAENSGVDEDVDLVRGFPAAPGQGINVVKRSALVEKVAAQLGPALEENDFGPRLGGGPGGRQPGRPPPDHTHLG